MCKNRDEYLWTCDDIYYVTYKRLSRLKVDFFVSCFYNFFFFKRERESGFPPSSRYFVYVSSAAEANAQIKITNPKIETGIEGKTGRQEKREREKLCSQGEQK